MTDAAVIAAAHAIERTPAFRKRFHDGPEPPRASTHPAAFEFARAALEAAMPAIRRDQIERDAQFADELKAAVAVEGDWSTLLPFGGLLRAQPPQCGSCNHEPGDPRVRVICECPCHGLTCPHPEEGTTDAATA